MSWSSAREITETLDPPAYSAQQFRERWGEVKKRSAELAGPSLADRLALCEAEEPGSVKALLEELGSEGSKALAFDREFWLRPKQLYPFKTAWRVLLFVAGRGCGKTRMAAEWIVDRLEQGARLLYFIGPTDGDIRKFMLGGAKARLDTGTGAGLFDVLPPWIKYVHKEDKGEIEFPDQRARLVLQSSYDPELRGPEPDTVWGDEVLKWRYPQKLLSNIYLATRALGRVKPAVLLTTSPKRLRFLRDLVMQPRVVTIWGDTDENRGNVDDDWLRGEHERLDGTRQGAEELGGELGYEDDGDLFKVTLIDDLRVAFAPALDRIVVAIDPAGSQHRTSDETGIIIAGRVGDTQTGHGYVLEDKSAKHEWSKWGLVAVDAAIAYGASAIVYERNHFADAVSANLRTAGAARGWSVQQRPGHKHLVDLVSPPGRRIQLIEVLAMGDKWSRASLVATLYESRRMHHVDHLPELENEQTNFQANPPPGSKSPNRLDGLAHAATELFELDRPPETDGKRAMQGLAAAHARLNAPAASGHRAWVSAGHGRRDTI